MSRRAARVRCQGGVAETSWITISRAQKSQVDLCCFSNSCCRRRNCGLLSLTVAEVSATASPVTAAVSRLCIAKEAWNDISTDLVHA